MDQCAGADRAGSGQQWVTGIDHGGITVASLDRSLAFYRDLLGLRVIEVSGPEGEDIGEVTGISGARIRAADLDAGDGRIIELLEYVQAATAPVIQQPNGPGCPHVALRVPDLTGLLQRLAAAGHEPAGQPVTITGALAWDGATVVYLRDPDGALIELIQRPGAGTAAS
ncbi:MAG TPA: VOC family protein [Streptosporangiaceae bacterium]|nr:VOC family protein [Streptosporangiaceae bacterium]